MSLQYIKIRYEKSDLKMSGSNTFPKYYRNKFISKVDMNTLSTYQIEHIFSWDFQTTVDMFFYVY